MRNASKTSSFQESDQAFLLASRRLIFPAICISAPNWKLASTYKLMGTQGVHLEGV
jgi:hypothetical protein